MNSVNMDDEIARIELATELTVAWLSNPNTRADAEMTSAFLIRIAGDLKMLFSQEAPASNVVEDEIVVGAVTARKSLASKDHIISMIDGKPYKTLRRHLSTNGMTPESYRARFGLRSDYPMVAEGYSQTRRDLAKKIGLGRKRTASK